MKVVARGEKWSNLRLKTAENAATELATHNQEKEVMAYLKFLI